MAYFPTYEQTLALLKDPSGRPHGSSSPPAPGRPIWAFCPCHPDGAKGGRRSLSIHPKYGIKCWAGCDKKDICDALGWTPVDDSPPPESYRNGHTPSPSTNGTAAAPRGEKKSGPPRREPDMQWRYTDEAGNVLAIHGRWNLKYDAKTFAWRLPSSPDWFGLGDELTERDLPPYGLEQLLDPSRKDEDVWIVEGEKDKDACCEMGLLAICWPGGADQKFFPKHYLRYFEGRNLIHWPDNDVVGWSFMNRHAIRTREFASTSRMLLVPGAREKEGAYDWFFKRQGQVAALYESLAGVITAPTTAFMASDTIQVTLPIDVVGCSPVQLTFKNLQATVGGREGHALNAKLEINLLGPATESYPYLQRINMLSHSARSSIARELSQPSMFGKAYGWEKILNTATVLVDRALATRQRGTDVANIPTPGEPLFHVGRKYPLNEFSLVFGDGQHMKSLQLQYEITCAALGLDVAGKYSTMPGPWVWVDYEQNDGKFRARQERIMAGLGFDEVMPMLVHYYPADGWAIADLIPNLTSFCEEHGIVGCVIDSAMPACGGDPNDNGLVSVMFNELSKLRMTTIVIAHITKNGQGNDKKPFGAGAWYYRPSFIWFVEKSAVTGHPEQLRCQWFNRKHRDNQLPADQTLLWTFVDPVGAISVQPTHHQPSKHDARPEVAIAQLLGERGPLSNFEVGEELDMSPRVVTNHLRSHPKIFVKIPDPKSPRWALKSSVSELPGLDDGGVPPELAGDPAIAPLLRFPASNGHTNGIYPTDDILPFDPPGTDDDYDA